MQVKAIVGGIACLILLCVAIFMFSTPYIWNNVFLKIPFTEKKYQKEYTMAHGITTLICCLCMFSAGGLIAGIGFIR